jgi:hypothetical protein
MDISGVGVWRVMELTDGLTDRGNVVASLIAASLRFDL